MDNKFHDKLSDAESLRYDRHLRLPDFGKEQQLKLKNARVLVIGAGGLGSPVLLYLAAAGVGTIGIIDPDRVSLSNLQRQVLYTEKDIGQLKVQAAREHLKKLNPHLHINTYAEYFTKENALERLKQYTLVVDGTDNFPTRYLVNDACILSGKAYIYGSIFRYEGQLSVFNVLRKNGRRGPNYRDLYPTPPPPGQVPSCAEGGVIGVLAGIIGSLQASEAIKFITGMGQCLDGQLYIFDSASFSSHTIKFAPRPDTHINKLIDYEAFCGLAAMDHIPSIDVRTFLQWQTNKKVFTLLDVREKFEHDTHNIGGQLIPVAQLKKNMEIIPTGRPLLVYCQSGIRSVTAVKLLMQYGFEQVFNLEGGLKAVFKPPSQAKIT